MLKDTTDFNPPTPWGVGPPTRGFPLHGIRFQSTHSVGSGTRRADRFARIAAISIHPLRGEWDCRSRRSNRKNCHFNPPTPWGVGRGTGTRAFYRILFQSTHSVGSGTSASEQPVKVSAISIHPLRGEWDNWCKWSDKPINISIHPLRGEWDVALVFVISSRSRFQSTHSVGSGTHNPCAYAARKIDISIHPLRGEWDSATAKDDFILLISIHPLRGEWDFCVSASDLSPRTFQSTHSVGSGTDLGGRRNHDHRISIHPLRGEWRKRRREA